jgi:HK97 family phage portal protein
LVSPRIERISTYFIFVSRFYKGIAMPSFWQRFGMGSSQHAEKSVYHGAQAFVVPTGQPVWMRRDYHKFADEGFRRNVIAYRAISMIASAAAHVPWKIEQTRGRRAGMLAVHPMLNLLLRPNPRQSGVELFETLYTHRLISGNAFLHAIGPKAEAPMELYALRPDRVAIIPGNTGLPKAYRYDAGRKAVDISVDRVSGQSRLLHLKHVHPLDDWYGLSPMEAAAYSIDQHNQCAAWNQALLQHGARPSGALLVKPENGQGGKLNSSQYSRLKQQLDEQFSGAENAGRPLLLEGGLEWQEMSHSPRDMDFVSIKHSSARDIALAFGVPPQLLGIPGDNTYANMKEARIALWEQTIIPLLQYTAGELSNWLAPMFDGNLRVHYDEDAIPSSTAKRDALWERVSNAGFLSDAEKRRLLGLEPQTSQGASDAA